MFDDEQRSGSIRIDKLNFAFFIIQNLELFKIYCTLEVPANFSISLKWSCGDHIAIHA